MLTVFLQYPSQHIGFLDAKHIESLEEFKKYCAGKGYFTPATDDKPASHDDETMLCALSSGQIGPNADLYRRYLRARKWVVQDAFKQFKDTEDWRKKNQIDKLYDRIDVGEYDVGRRLVDISTLH